MKKPKLAFFVIDNGGQMSVTSWGYSMFRLGISGVLDGYEVMVGQISYPYPAGALNQASQMFLKSDCDRMIIIDTDESFDPRHVAMLLSHDVPYVCGIYTKKMPGLVWPVEPIEDGTEGSPFSPHPDDENVSPLVPVARCARGFMNVHRSVFELMKPHCPEYLDAHTGEVHVEYWKGQPGGGSEDYNFCDRYRELGGTVYVDQRVRVWHHGMAKFPIAETYLRSKGEIDSPDKLG